jgi:hypothetical protein
MTLRSLKTPQRRKQLPQPVRNVSYQKEIAVARAPAGSPGTVSDAVARQYFELYFAARDVLESTLTQAEILHGKSTTAQDRTFYSAKILQIKSELETMKNKRRAFQASATAITPPSQAEVDQIKALAAKLDTAQANTNSFRDALAAVTAALAAFNKVQAG